jgi:hypothetical protein
MRESRGIALVQVEIQDILALVVGYGMAALLFRAFWPIHPAWSSLGLPGAGLYLWLGLAMSGPIIILRRRLARQPDMRRAPASENAVERTSRPQNAPGRISGTTWAERAWLLIGAYWIVLGIFIIPARLHEFKVGDVLLFGLAPVVVAIGLRGLGSNAPNGPDMVRGWTHTAAIALLVTWPLAWICLIVLGTSMRLR